MTKSIRVLIVEDSEDDARLIILALKQEGYDIYYKRVDTKEDMEFLLDNEKWDIVISDYSMPQFNGAEALELAQKKNQNLPFIVISGTIGEEVAVDMMKKGANDYIMKDNLNRLAVSIEREMREAKIRESKIKIEKDLLEAYRIINRSSTIAFLWKNEKGWPVEFATENVKKIFGYTAKELISGIIFYEQIIHPEDLNRVEDEVLKYSNDKTRTSFVHEPYRIITKNGKVRWLEDRSELRRDENGNITHFQGIIEDITERIKIMNDLIESEERYRTLFEGAGEGILVADIETKKFIYANPAICKMLGYTEKELLNLSVMDIHPKEFLEHVLSKFEAQARSDIKLALDMPCITKNGKIFYADINTTKLSFNNRECNIGFFTDITEKKKAEEEIRNLSKFPSENPNPVLRINKNGVLLYANKASLLQFSKWKLNINNPAPDILKKLTIQAFTMHKRYYEEELIYEEKTFLTSVSFPEDMDYINIYARNITERKKFEQLLKENEKKYRELVENINDWIWIIDKNGVFLYSSGKVKDILGYEATEIIGNNIYDLMPEDEKNRFNKICKDLIKKKASFKRIEAKYLHKDGSIKILEKSGNPILDNKGNVIGYRGIDRDITEQKNLEQQLFQAQKMESIGLLAGGIAHDFNNLLMAIMSYSKLIEMRLEKDSPLKVFINEIIEVSKKAANLIQNLLSFSRKQIIKLSPIDLHDLINGIKGTFLHIIREDVELITKFTKNKIVVMADSNAINQVFLNLVTNSCDAMPNRGYLQIKTEIIDIDNEFIKLHGFGKPGNYALISVSDTGIGMDKNVCEKIFDPFFTTKEVGKGTGLGLSVSYGIIRQHNGYINVYSEKGSGTTFRIYLPMVNKKYEKKKIDNRKTFVLEGNETILIVEDDQTVRKSLTIILTDVGYNVIEAVDGKDAIEKFNINKDKIDIILLDIIMPKLDGKSVYENIKNTAPETKFIFMSGYTAEAIKNKDFIGEEINFISKPILPDKLLEKIREVLER